MDITPWCPEPSRTLRDWHPPAMVQRYPHLVFQHMARAMKQLVVSSAGGAV